ncbi:MAG: hypothetical protein GEV28_33225 [Actinophytocola sp.]|uniref:helix-turn-helix domain-containing protein n=1 Tax=Actinophytocola sp. TaxID=1872138 RepID=UPI00132CB48C|nr:helix-turn-helix transcriptional regulator [Actinophytocola sp.]MPZ84990.1 hypothetical protein [Actinophytocola sp.]
MRQRVDELNAPHHFKDDFFETAEFRVAFEKEHMGKVIKAYRFHPHHLRLYGKALNQELVGRWLNMSQSQLSRFESGDPELNLETLRHCASVLHLPPHLLWFKTAPGQVIFPSSELSDALLFDLPGQSQRINVNLESGSEWTAEDNHRLSDLLSTTEPLFDHKNVLRLVHQWMVLDPPQIVQVSSGRHVGQGMAEQVGQRVASIRRMDDFVAGRDLRDVVEKETQATAALVREARYHESVGNRLLVAVGELCQLAGWVNDDAGRYGHAAHFYGTGISAAYAANDMPLAGNLISTLAYQIANVGNPKDAVLLARTAVRGTGRNATAKTRALFMERVAYAHARAGQRKSAEIALLEVEKLFAHSSNREAEPEWVYWLNEDEINVMAGRCFVELGLPERAVPLLEAALNGYSDEKAREMALYTSWLAEAQIMLGNIDEGVARATRALELTARTASTRSDNRIELLVERLKPHSNSSIVSDFVEYAQALGVVYVR